MPERTTADTLAARLAEGAADVGELAGKSVTIARDAIAYARGLEGAASAAEASRDRALDERDAARRLREATARRLWGKVDKARRERDQARALARRYERERQDLMASEERLTAALRFYADEDNWTQPTSWGGRVFDGEGRACGDAGERARRALDTIEGTEP